MKDKKSAKERFLDEFIGGVEDFDKHLAEEIYKDENPYLKNNMIKILEEQEDFGNVINLGLGREMWYSNDFFINCLILDFITEAEDDLVDELKQIWVGMLGKPGVNAEAINMDEESEGYLIKMHFEMDLNIQLISELVAYHVYGMQIKDMSERNKLLPEMAELLLYLLNKEALLKKAKEGAKEDQVDRNSPRLHIASELNEAGMKFVLGHEIGHHFLKHTESNGKNIVSKFIPTDVTSNQFHLDEFAADNFGFNLLIRGMKERNDNKLLAPLMVILMLAIYDRTPEEPSQCHPSLRDRYLNLLSRVSEHNEEVAFGLQQIFNYVATWINNTVHGSYWKTEWWK
ncbi:ImmA/IrrE family metallo-endopeptidase [Pseudobacillus sp. 179-B 2D1 NHS]|uniref:ImmA/IrrE family metallo-endopeptidase n=1 Tax=Pseudobacillus sp. 179-B 2D1 NHS TaxID=3374292 RepID=UPI0038795711